MDLEGAAVLDLFAGSGALGLEALSRGAAHALLVESDAKAAAVIRENIATVRAAGSRRCVRHRSRRCSPAPADRVYDLVLADPPYAVDEQQIAAILDALLAGGWIGEDSVVVLERSSRSPETVWPDAFEPGAYTRYAARAGSKSLPATVLGHEPRGLPRILRPGDQRSPRRHRTDFRSSSTRSWSRW